MKNIYILAVLVLIPLLGYGQEKPVKIFSDTEKGTISFQQGTLSLSASSSTTDEQNRIALHQARLVGGDLVIDFNLNEFRKRENDLKMKITPFVINDTGRKIQTRPKELEGNILNGYSSDKQSLQLTWIGFLDNYRYPDGLLEVQLQGVLSGPPPINCFNRPSFGARQQMPHYIAGGSFIGAILAGVILKRSSNQKYSRYIDESIRGISSADNTYDSANNYNLVANFTINMGIGLFVANALIYAGRLVFFKRKKKDFDYYCEQDESAGLSFHPYFHSLPTEISAGLQLAFRF